MKKLLFTALTGLTCFAAFAGITEADPSVIFKKATSYDESGIGFELINKSKRPIWIIIRNGEDLYPLGGRRALKVDAITPPKRAGVKLKLDINKPTLMAVYYQDPGKVEYKKTGLFGIVGKPHFVPVPNKLYAFGEAGQTLYLTWDKANYARPQTGPLGGKLGKTDSNLSLKMNVKKEDIKEAPQIAPIAPTGAAPMQKQAKQAEGAEAV